MLITLEKIKIVKALSEETTCFTADVYVNGKKAFVASNRGHGSCHQYDGNQSLIDAAMAYAKTLPAYTSPMLEGELPYDLDMLIDDLIANYEYERALKRDLKKVVFINNNKYFLTKAPATDDTIKAIEKAYPEAIILNHMPLWDAITLCKNIGM